MEKVFLYARRSNKKNQDRAISIEKQLEEMHKVCKEKWYEVLDTFQETQSGFKEWKRREFDRLLSSIKSRNIENKWERVDRVVVYLASRLCRNSAEAYELQMLIESEIVIFESITETFWENLEGKRLIINALTTAIYESKGKSTEWKKNMDLTYSRWEIAWVCPYGYTKISKKKIETNLNEAEIVREIFNLYSTWEYTYESLAQHLNSEWKKRIKRDRPRGDYWVRANTKPYETKFDHKAIENILIKWFYSWNIKVTYKKLTLEEAKYFMTSYPELWINPKTKEVTIDYSEIIKAKKPYEFLVTDDVYQNCIKYRNLWNRRNIKEVEINEDDIHPWRWLLKCPCQEKSCDNPYHYLSFTSEKKKGKYIYYRCSGISRGICYKTDDRYTNVISEKEIDNLVRPILSKLVFSNEEIKAFKELFTMSIQNWKKTKVQKIRELEKNLIQIKEWKDRLIKEYRNEAYEEIKNDIRKDIDTETKKIKILEIDLEREKNSWEEDEEMVDIAKYVKRMQDIKSVLDEKIPSKKKGRLNWIFEYVVVKNWVLVDYKLNAILELLILSSNKSSTSDNWGGWNSDDEVEPKESWTESQEHFPLLGTTQEGSPTWIRTMVKGFGDPYTNHCAMGL